MITAGDERETPVVEATGLARRYPGWPPIEALVDVDLRIEAGEMVAVVGPSGSGKSTLFNVIGTLDRPSGGVLLIDGVDVAQLSDRKLAGLRAARIGFVFQAFHLLDPLSAVDNVALGLLYQGLPAPDRRDRAMASLADVGLADRATARPRQLSGGERQRVAIARAVVSRPAIVLADEPTGNLDSTTSGRIVELLGRLNQHGTTIVVITHDPEVARAIPRTVRLRDGRIDEGEN